MLNKQVEAANKQDETAVPGDAGPSMDPLLWIQTSTDPPGSTEGTTTQTMMIGYAEATMIGVGRDGGVVGQPVNVDLGSAIVDDLVIYGDALYLQAGATYAWPGKNVTVVARQLALSKAGSGQATLSTSGDSGAAASLPTAPQAGKPGKASWR